MLESLHIHNYRCLKDLKISSFGRINLITGKNNTGKSSILEAIAIYASKGDINLIYKFLEERGENFRLSESSKNPFENNIRSLSSLFTNRKAGFHQEDFISIGKIETNLFDQTYSSQNNLVLRFIRYYDEILRDNQGAITRKRTILHDDLIDPQTINFKYGLEFRMGENAYILPLDEDRPYRFSLRNLNIGQNENYQFIRTRNIDREVNGKLFDNIALSEKEEYIIEALKIIEPETERIAFIEENSRERTAVIKLSSGPNILPLRSMGDGINRILTIILALINCDNGFLLIDEFENGLHYSVQEQLWKIIFNLSDKLKIQVVATTHSEDCIKSFENVLNNTQNKLKDGKLIRLDNINGVIKQVEYNSQELKIATDQNIETR